MDSTSSNYNESHGVKSIELLLNLFIEKMCLLAVHISRERLISKAADLRSISFSNYKSSIRPTAFGTHSLNRLHFILKCISALILSISIFRKVRILHVVHLKRVGFTFI